MGSKEKYKLCLCFTRKFRIKDADPSPDVKAVFAKFADNGTTMTAHNLCQFLTDHQGIADKEEALKVAEEVVERCRNSRTRIHQMAKKQQHWLSLEDFHHYLFNTDLNPPIVRSQVDNCEDIMSDPVSHYFVYTGHNSYLTGNQLSSDCSEVPIINALRRGVRVIELDMWPSSGNDDIDILHGRTLTSPVKLIKCLKAIKENAFSSSPYLVVITLEDHLTPDLQAKVAEMIIATFGDILFYPDEQSMSEFPSPKFLMNRIVISTKPPKEYLTQSKSEKDDATKEKEKDPQKIKDNGGGGWGKEVPDFKSELESDDKDEDEEFCEEDGNQSQKEKTPAAPEYKRIITISAGKPKGGLKAAFMIDPNQVRRLSLSEQQLVKASRTYSTDIVKFTQKNILRIYPKGTRFNSSNYNPFIGWMHGAQMVAFNMQGYGRSLWLMQGFFRENGVCGYIKKPDLLMNDSEIFDPQVTQPIKTTLTIKVHMGDGWRFDFKKTHFDIYSPPDFYTRVGIAGVPNDVVMKKTKTIEDDWTPVWDEEFSFPLTVPELAVVRIEVHEYDMSEKDDFAGQTCLPVSTLRSGFRAVPLYDRKGDKFNNVKLLLHFQFT
ncbi:Phosphoinositide phospholipase C [Zostera marina]|uniref:Phosphoinositide phospholipase C n=1 Tax=Zostera marina TaxID=29655 RepID=A0A0K9PFA1_ZOSMR|nr:Phosphoinositide phospholipase C [Zostera marina]